MLGQAAARIQELHPGLLLEIGRNPNAWEHVSLNQCSCLRDSELSMMVFFALNLVMPSSCMYLLLIGVGMVNIIIHFLKIYLFLSER